MADPTVSTAQQLKVTQVRSTIGAKPKVRESVRSLGLKRIHHSVVVDDSPVTRGYVNAARHLVTVEAVSASDTSSGAADGAPAGNPAGRDAKD